MSSYDKYNLMTELLAKGWKRAPDTSWGLVPPVEMLRKMEGKVFYVYEARDLQELADGTPDPA